MKKQICVKNILIVIDFLINLYLSSFFMYKHKHFDKQVYFTMSISMFTKIIISCDNADDDTLITNILIL